ncbi:uncharacterized protein PHALS_14652 [Plasmopara halstedii]|uniref:Uncharacterized protein n=1 Tax=Plasmopara halstedii TaxID=4781 RepID=A0A0P1ANM7_PLAHL|nr:uncharacterized protein PHALS_14652 [Plasmopara halstedii]CEG42741.1 hypothetical protein PHALS_14652 [Plasmopara halstedii]|eukprot:XP_024579110.1 hypothetical protein PHALS_14652 [Plasmopara halstedii]
MDQLRIFKQTKRFVELKTMTTNALMHLFQILVTVAVALLAVSKVEAKATGWTDIFKRSPSHSYEDITSTVLTNRKLWKDNRESLKKYEKHKTAFFDGKTLLQHASNIGYKGSDLNRSDKADILNDYYLYNDLLYDLKTLATEHGENGTSCGFYRISSEGRTESNQYKVWRNNAK